MAIIVNIEEGIKLLIFSKEKIETRILVKDSDISHYTAIPQDAIIEIRFKENQVIVTYLDKKEERKEAVFEL